MKEKVEQYGIQCELISIKRNEPKISKLKANILLPNKVFFMDFYIIFIHRKCRGTANQKNSIFCNVFYKQNFTFPEFCYIINKNKKEERSQCHTIILQTRKKKQKH